MFSRLKLSSVCVIFLAFAHNTAFAVDPLRQSWTDLDDEAYIENLVECKTTIKELQWSYNIWPKENKTEKPLFSAVLNKDKINQAVLFNLKKQAVLARQFGVELTAQMLQSEIDRMIRNSKDSGRLLELFASLNNNPTSIAECIARPNLVERLLQDQYSSSSTLHEDLKHKARSELWQYQQTRTLDGSTAEVYTTDFVVESAEKAKLDSPVADTSASISLELHEFAEKVTQLAEVETNPVQIQEFDFAFIYEEAIEETASSLKLKTLVWRKVSLNNWLQSQSDAIQRSSVSQSNNKYVVAEVDNPAGSAIGPPDTWKDFAPIPRVRTAHSAVWTGTEMIVWGGTGAYSGLLLNTGARYNPATGIWTATSLSGAPLARHSHTAVWSGTEMIIWGGSEGNENVYDTGGRYNPLSDSWIATSMTNAPSARRLHTSVWTGTEMILWGGNADGTQSVFLNTGGRYNPSTNSWSSTSTNGAPTERWLHTAVWTGTEMIVWGGGKGLFDFLDNGGHYNPSTDTWTATGAWASPTEPPVSQARINHSAVWTGTEMIIWGGSAGSSNTTITRSGGRYTPGTGTWTETSFVNAPSSRVKWSSVWTGTEMIIWGGVDPKCCNYNSGARYNPVSDTWTTTTINNAPSARNSHTAVWAEDEMIVFGGAAGTTEYSTGGRYNPLTGWKTTAPSNSVKTLTARSLHSAVWSGSEVLVWGGFDSNTGYLNDGGRYDPATDYWLPMTATGAPIPRIEHRANWTGMEMLVWGGKNDSLLGDGGRYNPDSDSWTAISTVNAPTARNAHTSVWTGTEWLVWGGNDGSPVNTGALYDPGLDSWSAITTTGAPTARELHSAIWADNEMIVWGGTDDDTGGRYDPEFDSWTATETLNAPDARNAHTAVWTGTEMLIWGGRDAGNFGLGSGARYAPDTGIWTEISLTGAPSGRFFHSADWTGTEMLIWGGLDASSTNTGSRYDPTNDSWTAMTTTNVPSARQQHTSIWSGEVLVVWGGATGSVRFNSGGRYNPDTDKWRSITVSNDHNFTRLDTVVWAGDRMIVWGGFDKAGNTNTGGAYDIATDTWTPLTVENAPYARRSARSVWTGSEVIIWGGDALVGNAFLFLDEGGLYNPVTDSWTATQTQGAPTGSQGFTSVWTGTEMIIWGGGQRGGALNPLSNTWMTIAEAPTKLSQHTAVWTGTEMLAWGGNELFVGPTSKGLRYVRSTDNWSEMTLTDAPAPRVPTKSVWSGSEFIIWGGYSGGAVGTGGRYDPSTDTWAPTSDSPLGPTWGHSAIWSGIEMVVWGGYNLGNVTLSNGARYNPVTNSWKTTSFTNAPGGTSVHKAVWSGSEMVTWGGHTTQYWGRLGIYYPPLELLPDLIFGGRGGGMEDLETP